MRRGGGETKLPRRRRCRRSVVERGANTSVAIHGDLSETGAAGCGRNTLDGENETSGCLVSNRDAETASVVGEGTDGVDVARSEAGEGGAGDLVYKEEVKLVSEKRKEERTGKDEPFKLGRSKRATPVIVTFEGQVRVRVGAVWPEAHSCEVRKGVSVNLLFRQWNQASAPRKENRGRFPCNRQRTAIKNVSLRDGEGRRGRRRTPSIALSAP